MLQHLPQNSVPTQGTNGTGNAVSHIQQAMEYVKANGGDARAAFYKLAQEKGVNPESILSRLR